MRLLYSFQRVCLVFIRSIRYIFIYFYNKKVLTGGGYLTSKIFLRVRSPARKTLCKPKNRLTNQARGYDDVKNNS